MKKTIKSTVRTNSYIEIARDIFLIFLIIGHSGYILAFAHYPFKDQRLFYNYSDVRLLMNLSSTMTIGFAAITGLFVFQEKRLALRNFSRILYIIVINFVLGMIILLSSGIGLGEGKIWWLLTGSRDSWYLYSILILYMIAPIISKLFEKRDVMYLFLGLAILVPLYAPGIPSPISSAKSTLWLLSIACIARYFRDKNFKYIYLLIFLAVISIKVWVSFDGRYDYDNHWHKDNGWWFEEIKAYLDYLTFLSLVLFLYNLKWYSPKVNAFVANTYFIYEFHYLTQILFANFLMSGDLHKDFYSAAAFSFGICLVFSFGATYIYKKLWIKKVQPKIYNGYEIFKKKIYKP